MLSSDSATVLSEENANFKKIFILKFHHFILFVDNLVEENAKCHQGFECYC